VASGYLNDPDFTQLRFVENPFGGSEKMYRSGDRGMWTENGDIVFLGRIDNQLKINGFRIDTTEIERAMLSHRFVRNACIAVDESGREKQLVAFVELRNELELVPSLGEYGVYDSFIYRAMASDPMRVSGYRAALAGNVEGQIGIDLGAGPQAPLARHTIDAGAEKVYAVEVDPDTASKAKEFLERAGLSDRIIVINNDIRDLQLPDKPDFCVSALAGNIASSDGCITLISAARSVLPKGIRFFPNKYHTLIAAVDFSRLPLQHGFDEMYSHYAEEVFKQAGNEFDLRLCVKNFDERHLISTSAVCETIDYEGELKANDETSVVLRVTKAGVFDGVLCWLNAISNGKVIIDSISKTHHLPVFIPLTTPVQVSEGDRIGLVFKRQVSSDDIHPDYLITGSVSSQDRQIEFEAASYHHSRKLFRSNKYHRAIINENGKIGVIERPSERAVHEYLKESLPVYMVPSAIVKVDEIPLTIVKKIDKQKLLNIFHEKKTNEVNYVRPVTRLEHLCAEIWQSVLGKEQIGLTDDFFYHGGDSIKVIQVASRLRVHGYQVEVRNLFEKSILADFVAALQPINQATTTDGDVSGPYLPTPVQKEIFGRRRSEPNHYNQAIMVRCEERVEEAMISAVFRKLLQHHDALRTVVSLNTDRLEPLIKAEMDVVVETFDYRGGDDQVPRSKLDELQASIDTTNGPLIRLALFKMNEGDQLLIFCHHFIIDSVSWMILMQDIITLINQFSSGQALALPPKTTSFKTWAQALDEYSRSSSVANNSKYWREMLMQGSHTIPVVQDAEKFYSKSTTISISLDNNDTERLTREANKTFRTQTNELILTALGIALNQRFGSDRVLVMIESHGRIDNLPGVDLTRTVGWFTSFYPVPLVCRAIDREGEYITSVCNTLRGVPNLGVDYGILSQNGALPPHKDRIQISFNFLGELDENFRDPRFKTIRSYLGALQGKKWEREFALDVSGLIANGKLSINFTFNEQQINRSTIEALGLEFKKALSQVTEFCCSYDQSIVPVNGMTYNQLSEKDLKSLFD
jgi:non-ribosomal peptide synthase protein (TIGR01720 family)